MALWFVHFSSPPPALKPAANTLLRFISQDKEKMDYVIQ